MWPVEDTFAGLMTIMLVQGVIFLGRTPSQCLGECRFELATGAWKSTIEAKYKQLDSDRRGDLRTHRFIDRLMSIPADAFCNPNDFACFRCFGTW